MSLKQQLINLHGVTYSEESSTKAILKDLSRRGKLDLRTVTEIVFLLADEIELLKTPKPKAPKQK